MYQNTKIVILLEYNDEDRFTIFDMILKLKEFRFCNDGLHPLGMRVVESYYYP